MSTDEIRFGNEHSAPLSKARKGSWNVYQMSWNLFETDRWIILFLSFRALLLETMYYCDYVFGWSLSRNKTMKTGNMELGKNVLYAVNG